MAYVNVYISRCEKEELAWAIDRLLRVVSSKISYSTKKLKNQAVINLKQYCMHYYMTFSNVL